MLSGMSQHATADDDVVVVVLGTLAAAVAELRDALETIAGKVDLEGEATFLRANLDKASSPRWANSVPDGDDLLTMCDTGLRRGCG
jgi:hypothetical protein